MSRYCREQKLKPQYGIIYKVTNYQQRRRGEYNISKSAQQPIAKVG